jgi:hypothetical protein
MGDSEAVLQSVAQCQSSRTTELKANGSVSYAQDWITLELRYFLQR